MEYVTFSKKDFEDFQCLENITVAIALYMINYVT